MGQITKETIKMIREHAARKEHAPLTIWEVEQLATAWERIQPAASEADSQPTKGDVKAWHRSLREALKLPADAPYRFDYYAQMIEQRAASEAEVEKLRSAYVGACDRIDRLLREKDAASEADPVIRNPLITASEAEKRVAELEAARIAYASEFPPNADGEPDVGNIHANIRALKAKVAASEAGGVPVAEVVSSVDVDGDAYIRAAWIGKPPAVGTRLFTAHPSAPGAQGGARGITGRAIEDIAQRRTELSDQERGHLMDGARYLLNAAPIEPGAWDTGDADLDQLLNAVFDVMHGDGNHDMGMLLQDLTERVVSRLAAPPSAPAAEPVPWANFPAYLIDHCEGDTISEEGLQHALAAMLADPQYAAPAAWSKRPDPELVAAYERDLQEARAALAAAKPEGGNHGA